jgi:hypothetical protein
MIQRSYLLGDKFHVLLLLPVVDLLNYINKSQRKGKQENGITSPLFGIND